MFIACMLQVGGFLGQGMSVHIETSFAGVQNFTKAPESGFARRFALQIIFVTCLAFLMHEKYQLIPITLLVFGTIEAFRYFTVMLCETSMSDTLMALFESFSSDVICQNSACLQHQQSCPSSHWFKRPKWQNWSTMNKLLFQQNSGYPCWLGYQSVLYWAYGWARCFHEFWSWGKLSWTAVKSRSLRMDFKRYVLSNTMRETQKPID